MSYQIMNENILKTIDEEDDVDEGEGHWIKVVANEDPS